MSYVNGTIPRKDYLETLMSFRKNRDVIKVISGVRRCGKSTLLMQFAEELKASGVDDGRIFFLNLEREQYAIDTDRMLYTHLKNNLSDNKPFVLLDEVQLVKGWEKAVNNIRVEFDADIYITGSNANLLSSELGTLLTGRYVEIHMLPFSFREFLERYPVGKESNHNERFRQFMEWGGMPIIDLDGEEMNNLALLDSVFNSIIVKDIMPRLNADISIIGKIVRFLLSNSGRLVSAGTISKESFAGDPRTVEKYLGMFRDSFLFYDVDNYDVVGKRMLKTRAKYYPVDPGFRKLLVGGDFHEGSVIECIVYLELVRRGYRVRSGSYGDSEIDFTAFRGDTVEYYQVSKTLSSERTKAREEKTLRRMEGGRKIILTMDRDIHDKLEGVEYVNVVDFLLDPDF